MSGNNKPKLKLLNFNPNVTLTCNNVVVSVHPVTVSPAAPALPHAQPVLDAALLPRRQRIRATVVRP